jgi:hypothetical protein
MSHFSITKLKIKIKNEAILKRSIEEIAKRTNGEIVTTITDYYGNLKTDFIIAFRNPEFQRGVGVRINNGELELIGDFWGVSKEKIEELKKNIAQTYTKNATIQALKQMNYNVNISETKNKIHITAWRI